ncbi:hypothetical protein FKM82_027710 [Ascaphus truei]
MVREPIAFFARNVIGTAAGNAELPAAGAGSSCYVMCRPDHVIATKSDHMVTILCGGSFGTVGVTGAIPHSLPENILLKV